MLAKPLRTFFHVNTIRHISNPMIQKGKSTLVVRAEIGRTITADVATGHITLNIVIRESTEIRSQGMRAEQSTRYIPLAIGSHTSGEIKVCLRRIGLSYPEHRAIILRPEYLIID